MFFVLWLCIHIFVFTHYFSVLQPRFQGGTGPPPGDGGKKQQHPHDPDRRSGLVCQRLEIFSYFLSYGFVFIFLFLYIIFLSRSLGYKGAPDHNRGTGFMLFFLSLADHKTKASPDRGGGLACQRLEVFSCFLSWLCIHIFVFTHYFFCLAA